MSADLAADTRAIPDPERPGRYHIALPDHWDYLMPSGGVVMTAALRAAETALGEPQLRLASATSIFCTPIGSGPLVADVTVLRRGGATAQLRVAVKNRDAPPAPRDAAGAGAPAAGEQVGMELSCTFVRDRKGPDVKGLAWPRVRALGESPSADDDQPNNPHARFRFYKQIETRIAAGERYWTDGLVAGPPVYARWMRFRHAQRDGQGRFDRLAMPPLIDTMPTALHRAIGPGPYRFYAPSLDLTTYCVDDTTREWLLVAVTLQRARAGWAVANAEVWDDEGRYVAYGAQAMYLHGLAGEPPIVDASERT